MRAPYFYPEAADSGLQIINISDPQNPSLAGSYDTPDDARGVYVVGDYAYVADDFSGLRIIDISDPQNPTYAGSYDTPDYALGVYVVGDYAYVADEDSGLQIINISDPQNPTLAGSYDMPGRAYGVYVLGGYAYVAARGGYGLQIINISDPQNPTLAGRYNSGWTDGVYVLGDYAYVVTYSYGLQIIDISNPQTPTLAGNCDTPGHGHGVYVVGDYAYVADGYSGLRIIDTTNMMSAIEIGFYDIPHDVERVYVLGDYAYVAVSDLGLGIIDVSDPQNPTLVGNYDTPGYGNTSDVYVLENYAYVADDSGLQIINISDPQNPSLAGSYDTPDWASGVYVFGDYAYVADNDSGLQIINISDPQNPTLAGSYDTPDYARGVYVLGDYAYVADDGAGLQIIDISDPQNPTLAGSYDTPDYARGVYVFGDYAYVADDGAGLQIIDISDPQNPSFAGSYDTPDNAEEVYVRGDYAYVANEDSGLQIIDISDPQNPTLAGSYDTPDDAIGVYVLGDYAYVADGDNGLLIIRVSYPLTNTSILDSQTITTIISSGVPEGTYNVVVTNPNGHKGMLSGGLEMKRHYPPQIYCAAFITVRAGETFTLSPSATDPEENDNVSFTYFGWMTTNEKATDYSDVGSHEVTITATDDWGLSSFVTVTIEVVVVPLINSITSDQGSNETLVTISGEDFAAGAMVLLVSKPNLVGTCLETSPIGSVAVDGDYAYVQTYYKDPNSDDEGPGDLLTLQIIDISDQENPFEVGSCATPSAKPGVHISGDYAYVLVPGDILIINVTDKTSPVEVGTYSPLQMNISSMYGSGDYISITGSYNWGCYAQGCSGSFRGALDISDKTNPVTVDGTFDYHWYPYSYSPHIGNICALGNYLYVPKSGGIRIFDATDKANTVELGSYCLDDYTVSNMQIVGDYIYATCTSGYSYGYYGDTVYKIIDITDKVHPVEVGAYTNVEAIKAIYPMGDYVFFSMLSDVMCLLGGYIYTSGTDAGGLQISELIPKQGVNVSVDNSQTITATVPASFWPGIYNLYVTNPDGRHAILYNAFIITPDICLSAGLNLFGYPIEPSSGYTSYYFMGDLGTENEVSKIQRYDPNTKSFETTTYSNGSPSGDIFDIVSGEGYFVYM